MFSSMLLSMSCLYLFDFSLPGFSNEIILLLLFFFFVVNPICFRLSHILVNYYVYFVRSNQVSRFVIVYTSLNFHNLSSHSTFQKYIYISRLKFIILILITYRLFRFIYILGYAILFLSFFFSIILEMSNLLSRDTTSTRLETSTGTHKFSKITCHLKKIYSPSATWTQ